MVKKKSEQVAKFVETNLLKKIMYLERKGIPVYWKLDKEGKIIVLTTDLKIAKEKGCVRSRYS